MQKTEKLKQEIRSRNDFNGKNVTSHRAEAPVPQYVTPPPAADNAAPAMKTLDKAEFQFTGYAGGKHWNIS